MCQELVSAYTLLAYFSNFLPDIFHFSSDIIWDVLHQFAIQHLPDVLVIFLLFMPHCNSRFFNA
ncbi:MAG: YbjO family protein [Candidatus Malihini olakiniferum]